MSNNMIKGYSVSYDTKTFKKLDFTNKEEKIREDVKNIWLQQFPGQEYPEEDDFKPGLEAEEVKEEPGTAGMSAEELEEFKKQVRAEVTEEVRAEVEAALSAENKAKVESANAQAAEIIAEAMERGRAEGEAAKAGIITLASSEGYEAGIKKAEEEKNAALASLEAEKKQLKEDYEKQVSELEPAFVEILKEYVKKITGIAYENHTEVLRYLIDSAISRYPKDTSFEVKLSVNDYNRLSPEFDSINQRYEGKLSLSFSSETDLKNGEVKLENQDKVIECGLGVVTEGLLDALDMLAAKDDE